MRLLTYRDQVTPGQVKCVCNSAGYLVFSHLLFSRIMEDPAQGWVLECCIKIKISTSVIVSLIYMYICQLITNCLSQILSTDSISCQPNLMSCLGSANKWHIHSISNTAAISRWSGLLILKGSRIVSTKKHVLTLNSLLCIECKARHAKMKIICKQTN